MWAESLMQGIWVPLEQDPWHLLWPYDQGLGQEGKVEQGFPVGVQCQGPGRLFNTLPPKHPPNPILFQWAKVEAVNEAPQMTR